MRGWGEWIAVRSSGGFVQVDGKEAFKLEITGGGEGFRIGHEASESETIAKGHDLAGHTATRARAHLDTVHTRTVAVASDARGRGALQCMVPGASCAMLCTVITVSGRVTAAEGAEARAEAMETKEMNEGNMWGEPFGVARIAFSERCEALFSEASHTRQGQDGPGERECQKNRHAFLKRNRGGSRGPFFRLDSRSSADVDFS